MLISVIQNTKTWKQQIIIIVRLKIFLCSHTKLVSIIIFSWKNRDAINLISLSLMQSWVEIRKTKKYNKKSTPNNDDDVVTSRKKKKVSYPKIRKNWEQWRSRKERSKTRRNCILLPRNDRERTWPRSKQGTLVCDVCPTRLSCRRFASKSFYINFISW